VSHLTKTETFLVRAEYCLNNCSTCPPFAQKSTHVTFSSVFSSKYTKIRTSHFRKVVRHYLVKLLEVRITLGMVGSVMRILLEIYFSLQQRKIFKLR